MTANKRTWKLQEFVAHSDNVTCLAIGPTSGRVMVTGGEDKKVNMWAIGKPNVILSLSGHTSSVECVQFNVSEELVCAGSQSGSLKIWDLEAAKIVRTLTGHKANVKSIDFHPYGDFAASGSLDTTVRLWDIRRKGCIVSYKGHTNSINHLRFSPDGRWIISAGEDGTVKLWDLNAGKLLADFILHTGPVNRVEFHPREFLVATGSSDRTVKFWDLETFGLISSTEVEATAVRTIGFHPEGLCLFSGANDSLRTYQWEPSRCCDAQTLGWGKVSDIAFSSNQLIGASYQATNVSIWVVNMNNIVEVIDRGTNDSYVGQAVEINQSAETPAIQQNQRKQSPQRKSFTTRPKTSSSKPKKPEVPSKDESNDYNKALEEKLSSPYYENVFSPQSALERSPDMQHKSNLNHASPNKEVFKESILEGQKEVPSRYTKEENFPMPVVNSLPVQKQISQPKQPIYQSPTIQQKPFQPPISAETTQNPIHSNAVEQTQYSNGKPPESVIDQSQPSPPTSFPVQYQQQPRLSQAPPKSIQTSKPQSFDNNMKGLNLNDFSKAKENNSVKSTSGEDSTLEILGRSHDSLCQIMQARLQNLSLVSRLWTDGDIKASVETASSMSDMSVFVDIMNVLVLKQTLWSLDLCCVVLPQLQKLLSSNYESYVDTGSSSLKLVIKNFGQLIKSTLSTPPGALGVDLSREERYNKCDNCYRSIKELRNVITERFYAPSRIGSICKELAIALNVID